jgi:polysaccharide biosynthesis protein PslG
LRKLYTLIALSLLLPLLMQAHAALASPAPQTALDYAIPDGRFFTQTNGSPLGTSPLGYSVTNRDGVRFWDAFVALGGEHVVGYPVSRRFIYDGFVTQAMQKMVFQWRPERGEVYLLNTFDAMHDKGLDSWLLVYRQTPEPFDTSPDTGLSWAQVIARHLAFLDTNEAIKERFLSNPSWLDHYGLPLSYADMGNSFVLRAQRATFQHWKEDVPWAKRGDVSVANGGDLAKEAGLWPAEAVVPESSPSSSQLPIVAPAPTAIPLPTAGPTAPTSSYRAKSPEYGINLFVMGYPATTQRDLTKATSAGFGWHKTLFQWRHIEGQAKGVFDWTESDRVVRASEQAGIKIIARLDFQPDWARADRAHNGPPDNYQDFADFVFAFVSRYKAGSPHGRVDAIEIWNEPNLAREWGDKRPSAAEYTQLLKLSYQAAKRADPSVTVVTAGLTPTGTWNDEAVPDDIYLQQMYDLGAKAYFDVLGAHGAGFKAPPSMSPDAVAANPAYGGHRFFTFRRVEDLRAIMERNGDASKQIWLLEFGWTSDEVHPEYAWHSVTEEQKAQYIVEAFRWAHDHWSPWIGVMALWNLPAPDWTTAREEYWWSVANTDGSDRPAYSQFKWARESGFLP